VWAAAREWSSLVVVKGHELSVVTKSEHKTLRETPASPSAKCTWGRKKHSGKPSASATLEEGLPVTLLTVKRPSPSAKSRALGEAFPERRASSRGRFNAVGAIRFFLFLKKNIFPECITRGRNLFFKKSSSPSATLGEKIHFFKKIIFPECLP
jgi:hypothetical protein